MPRRFARARDLAAGERGQATTETILLSWLLVMLLAAAYQVFLVNDQISRAITVVHAELFRQGFAANHHKTEYNMDENANVIWRRADIPEVVLPTLTIFQRSGTPENRRLPEDFRIRTTPAREAYYASEGMADPDAKRTRMGAGTYMNVFEGIGAGAEGLIDQVKRIVDTFDAWRDWLGL